MGAIDDVVELGKIVINYDIRRSFGAHMGDDILNSQLRYTGIEDP